MHRTAPFLILSTAVAAAGCAGCGKRPEAAPAATVLEASQSAPTSPVAPPMSVATDPVRFELTDNTEIEWTGYKIVGSHSGSFLMYEGTIDLPDGTLGGAHFDVIIETMSVITDNETLTGVVKGDSFFDVNDFPEATFVSTGVDPDGEAYLVTGDLTLRDVTKTIRFPASMSVDDGVFTLTAEFTVNRRDWGIVYDGIGDNLLKDEVLISLQVEGEQAAGEG